MSLYRQQVEVSIIPKLFKCLSFGYKSDYNIAFKLIHESQKGKKITAFPFIVKSPNLTRQRYRNESKEAKGNAEVYQTQQFNVMFEDEDFELNEMCIFKIEYNGKKLHKGKTYLQVSLLSHRNIIQKSEIIRSQIQIEKVCREVFKKKIYLNRSNQEISQFYQVDFTQNQYFGYLILFIGTAHLGWNIRRNKIGVSEFVSLPNQERQKLMNGKQQKAKSVRTAGKLIRNTVKQYILQIQKFYELSVIKQIQEHNRIVKMYEKYSESLSIDNQISSANFDEDYFERNFEEHYDTKDINELYFYIHREGRTIANYNRLLWKMFYTMILQASYQQSLKIFAKHIQRQKQEWVSKTCVFSVANPQSLDKQKKNFKNKRKNILRNAQIYDEQDAKHPLIFFEKREDEKKGKNFKIESLVIFIHGYQGSRHDLEKASNYLIKNNYYCDILRVKSLQNYPQLNIEDGARVLSQEIKSYIKTSPMIYQKISILGYSLGGILARALIENLQEYKDHFNLLITLSSPHLGLQCSENQLVRVGLWYMTKFQKIPMISDMKGREKDSCQKSYMKILSEKKNLSWFKKVIIVGCKQDEFVPYCSSTISESTKDEETIELSKNIKDNAQKIEKVEVWFDIQDDTGTLDKLTGRRCHIQFLDNDKFLSKFFYLYSHQF